jgi:hypothetical protein
MLTKIQHAVVEDDIHDAGLAQAGERLAALKHRYDPGNIFRLNQNIAPGLNPATR